MLRSRRDIENVDKQLVQLVVLVSMLPTMPGILKLVRSWVLGGVGASRRVFHHKGCCVACAVVCAARLLSERVCWVVRV